VNKFAFTTGVTTAELAGTRNFLSGSFGSLPRWRGNITGTFERGSHDLFAVARYTSAYRNDDPVGLVTVPRIKKFVTFDVQYGYQFKEMFGADTKLTIGVKDIFDNDPPNVGDNRPGFDEQVHSPRGRVVYVGLGLKY
jgi:iron complex outermembrane receptor protein